MSPLDQHLRRLLDFLATTAQPPPEREIRIIEIDPNNLDERGRCRAPRSALHTAQDYEPRFSELIRVAPAWINMTCLGVAEGFLIVGIEVARTRAAARTSVNYSGPSNSAVQNDWAADQVLVLE